MHTVVSVRRSGVVALALAVLAAFCGVARAQDFDRWYQVRMSGSPAGWSRVTQATKDGLITTSGDFVFKIKRGPVDLTITMKSIFVETEEGKPVSMRSVQKMGEQPVETGVTFEKDGMAVESTQGGRTTKSVKPLPKGEWMTPGAAARYSRERAAAGDKEIVVRTMDPLSSSEPITMTRKMVGPETITVGGKNIATTRSVVESSIAPGVKTVEYADEQGIPVKSQTKMGGLDIELIAAGPEVVDGVVGEAPEMMVATFVRPDRKIDRPRKTRSAVYLLSVAEDDLPEIPSAGAQRVEKLDAHRARVSVDLGKVQGAPAAESDDAQFRVSTAILNTQDGAVQKLAKRATAKAGEGKAERAEAIRRYVYKFIKDKNLNTAFATASEVASTKAGDCTEHGVLTAALLRVDGIPSRVVVGMIYADQFAGSSGIFGYHMWAQALLEVDGQKRWVDLDATLPDSTPFDATHIALGISSLGDDQAMTSMIGLATMLGRVKIVVESVE